MQKDMEYGDAIRFRVFSGCLPWGWCFAGDGAQRTPGGAVQGVPSAFLLGYQKAKVLEIIRFRGLLARREGFEPPAFWSVGCSKHKSESFRLRFVLFTTVRSADFPLFPSRPACSGSVLGQKWVKEESSCFSKNPQYLLQFPPKRLSAVRHPSAAAYPKRI